MANLNLSTWDNVVSVFIEDMPALGQLTVIRSTTVREGRVLLLNLFDRSNVKKK